jgi:membrane protein
MSRSSSASTRASDPEADDRPDSPGEITKSSWIYIARKTAREFSKDQCTDLAAALTYYAVLALFPAAIALISLVGLVSTLRPTLTSLAGAKQAAGVAFVVGLATALWSASGYVGSFGRAMNRMYEIGEGRPIWKLRPLLLLVTLLALVLAAAVALALVLTGPAAESVGSALGLGSTAVLVWNIAKWPVMLGAVVLIVATLYYATPNVKQPKFRWISVGALFAIVTWIVASALFGFYVANFASYNKTYGSLAGVVVFLLWLWITNLALLFGAELDAELERGRELQAGMAAEQTIQLPPRDTRNIKKAQDKQRKDIERGRRLRTSRGESETLQKEHDDAEN